MTPYLSIESLNVGYGSTRVLNDVSLDVARGELVALLGSSGCGKTTLLRSIAGFVVPESGTIKVDGRDIAPLPPDCGGQGAVEEDAALQVALGGEQLFRVPTELERRPLDALEQSLREDDLLPLDGREPVEVDADGVVAPVHVQ